MRSEKLLVCPVFLVFLNGLLVARRAGSLGIIKNPYQVWTSRNEKGMEKALGLNIFTSEQ